MKRPNLYSGSAALLALTFALSGSTLARAQVTVVNMIPQSRSNETVQDAEPNLAVNLANPLQIAGSAFTPDPLGGPNAPIYVSTDGGNTWALNSIVPGNNASFGTGDITLRFGDTSNVLYAGILRGDSFLRLNILRTSNFLLPTPMTVLVNRQPDDQPYIQAATLPGFPPVDRVYVGSNDLSQGFITGRTASVDRSLDAATAPPAAGFSTLPIETRATAATIFGNQDGPSVRPAIHPDGTIYAAYFGWRVFSFPTNTSDVVVVRDDNWAAGVSPFTDLVDPVDTLAGVRVVTGVSIPALGTLLGAQRIGSSLSIAVDPTDSQTVYLSWADGASANAYTLHVRRSTDGGATWTGDLRSIVPATNPALAINSEGKVAFLYQTLVGPAGNRRWETHLERTEDGFATAPSDLVLSDFPDGPCPGPCGAGPLGDYAHLMAVGRDFYGVFSANNTPDMANFPNGVTYQRNANFVTHQLRNVANTANVSASSDPFFFKVVEAAPQIQVPGGVGLGDVCVGGTSAGTLNVCNTGKDDLIVDPITSSDPQFAVTTPSSGYPVTISHDFCFPFHVVFSPAAAGAQSATLTVPSNDPDTPNTAVAVSGSGTEPDIRVTGSTDLGVASAWRPADKTVSVCNTGGCNLSVSAAAVGCADFSLVNNPFPATVSPDSCLDMVVRFTPVLPGPTSCGLTVASNDPDTPVVNRTLTARTPPSFSLHAGLVDPNGALAAVAKNGATLNLDFVYPFAPKWAWDVRLGHSSFDGQAAQPDTDLWTLLANAKFTINPGAPVRVFLDGGLGLYRFDPGDFEGGGNLGLGLNVPVGSRFAFEPTYNYHWVFTASPTLKFSQYQLGFLVSF